MVTANAGSVVAAQLIVTADAVGLRTASARTPEPPICTTAKSSESGSGTKRVVLHGNRNAR